MKSSICQSNLIFKLSHFLLGHDRANMVHRIGVCEGDAVGLGGLLPINLRKLDSPLMPGFIRSNNALPKCRLHAVGAIRLGLPTPIGAALASGSDGNDG